MLYFMEMDRRVFLSYLTSDAFFLPIEEKIFLEAQALKLLERDF